MHHGTRALILAAVTTSVLTVLSPEARAGRVWVVFDRQQVTCRPIVEDELACLVYDTNFNDNAITFPDDGAGRPGERVVIAGPAVTWDQSVCPLTTCIIGDRSGSLAHYQCLEDHLHLPLQDDDVILNYETRAPSVSCNDPYLVLRTPSGTSVHVRGAVVWGENTDDGSWCNGHGAGLVGRCCMHTHYTSHELFEAAANVVACDGCSWPTWQTVSCGSGMYFEQPITHYSGGSATGCALAHVVVSSSSPEALCEQPLAARARGECLDDDFVTCPLALTVEHCAHGCSTDPTPHCITFDAQCTTDSPTDMCSGATAPATVTCTNTGGTTWDASLLLVSWPTGRDSLFEDTSWISPRIPTAVQPTSVPPTSTGRFSFVLHAPSVLGPIDYSLHWALAPAGGTPFASPLPGSIAMDVSVHPCAPGMDGGVHGDGGPRRDGGADGGLSEDVPGCACSATPTHVVQRAWIAVIAVASASALRARRAKNRRNGRGERPLP